MKFTLLIQAPTGSRPEPGTSDFDEESAAYRAFTQQVIDAGVFVTGDRLEPARAARVVQVRDGRIAFRDDELEPRPDELGGYYVLDCRDIDEAVDWASRIPTATFGQVDVRPSRILH